jgi:hypothetical protein
MMAAPVLIIQPFAADGDQAVVPQTDPNAFVSFTTGYSPDYEINLAAGDPAAKAVERPVQNWLFNMITANLQQYQQNGLPLWYSGMPGGYVINAQVLRTNASGNLVPYRSLVNNNVADPLTSTTNWEYVPYGHEMLANVPMPTGGPNGPTNALISVATNFNSIPTGTYWFSSDAIAAASPNAPAQIGSSPVVGLLEVLSWTVGANTWIVQRYLDRNAQMYVRAATNGAWTAWRNFFTQSAVFAVGEIKLWYGNPASIPTVWGPGWHLCDGTSGTVDMRGVAPIGAGGTYANGARGGSTTASLVTANLPAHGHPVSVSDPGHAHSVYDPSHNHGINDPGHAHSVADPGHSHGYTDNGHAHSYPPGGWCQAGQDNGGATAASPANQYGSRGAQNTNGSGIGITINGSGVGIGIYGNGTGVYNSAAATGIGIYGASTGISASAGNTGSGTAFNVQNPYVALCFVQYTGA